MILPTKRVEEDRALLTLGAKILDKLREPKTVSRLWDEVKRAEENEHHSSLVTYDWFVLSLDLLYALGTIDLEHGRLRSMMA